MLLVAEEDCSVWYVQKSVMLQFADLASEMFFCYCSSVVLARYHGGRISFAGEGRERVFAQ